MPTTAVDSLYTSPRAADRATALISIRNCVGDGIAGATIAIAPPASIAYQGAGTATNGTGAAYALDVASGSVTVNAGRAAAFTFDIAAGELAIVYLVQP